MRSCQSSENIWAMLIALEYNVWTDVISTFMTAICSGFDRFSKMGTAAVPEAKRRKPKRPPPLLTSPQYWSQVIPHLLRGDAPL
jgi:hypothetical protein